MKKTNLKEIKDLTLKEIAQRINSAKLELADLSLDKNTNKLKDIKSLAKKRKDIAQMLTIVRQKELIVELEPKIEKEPEESKEPKVKKVGKAKKEGAK